MGSTARHTARETAAPAGDVEDAEAGYVADLFGDQLMPGRGTVVVAGIGVVMAFVARRRRRSGGLPSDGTRKFS